MMIFLVISVIVLLVWCGTLQALFAVQRRINVRTRDQLLQLRLDGHGPGRSVPSLESLWDLKCGCGHDYALHDRTSGRCRHKTHNYRDDYHRTTTILNSPVRCSCAGYSGPPPPTDAEVTERRLLLQASSTVGS